MNATEVAKAKDPDLRSALNALRRAAQAARQTAIQTNTHVFIVKNGRLKRIGATELVELAVHLDQRPA